ncbi:MAG: phosphoribosylanthranilate isomerase [Candidatus Binatota bacterium]|nr:phosphoribosylanthranilate isomerase [Candidatus Binatota bacterium]
MSVRVKICGVTRREDALAAVDAGADAIGVNLWPGSKRCVAVEEAAAIVEGLPEGVLSVGVFVNAPRAAIAEAVRVAGLGAVQLHGDESPEDCTGWSVRVIKALAARDGRALADVAASYAADFVLVDAYVPGEYGGTGTTFPWDRVAGLAPERLFLAGGLTPENVAEAVRQVGPYAVDVAGGVESRPGIKDPEKMREFVRHAKAA